MLGGNIRLESTDFVEREEAQDDRADDAAVWNSAEAIA